MNGRHEIKIEVNAANPVEYLACCGIFEIVSRFDETALAHWQTGGATVFVLETVLSEEEFFETVKSAISDKNNWNFKPDSGGIYQATLKFEHKDKAQEIILDWWYERLSKNFQDSKKTDVDAKEWSAWKMYAGTVQTHKVFGDLIVICQRIVKEKNPQNFADLISSSYAVESGVKGRTNFDPRNSRNELDAGFSANKVKDSDTDSRIDTYAFCEILAIFGAQGFFPNRTHPQCQRNSTRGWQDGRHFSHVAWKEKLPITLARLKAIGFSIDPTETVTGLSSLRVKERGEQSNLTFSTVKFFGGEQNERKTRTTR